MRKSSPYSILGVSESATQEEVKSAYRKLAHIYHPDKNNTDSAAARFCDVSTAYEILSDRIKRARYDKSGSADPVIIRSRRGEYELDGLVVRGDIADIHKARNVATGDVVALKIARHASSSDLLSNEYKSLRIVRPTDEPEQKYNRYFSRAVETFRINDGKSVRQVNVLDWLEHWWPLGQVRQAHRDSLVMNHGVWMFNRLLGGLGHIHRRKRVIHGAILPCHALAYDSGAKKDPMNHGIKLVDWCYSVPMGERIKAVVPGFEDFYPPEVLAKKGTTPGTDIYMAAKCVIYVLGGNPATNALPGHCPKYLERFLKGCVIANQASRPQDAWDLHSEFTDFMRSHYGPRKYFQFNMPTAT